MVRRSIILFNLFLPLIKISILIINFWRVIKNCGYFADADNISPSIIISLFNKDTYQWENIYTPKDRENNYYRGLGVVEMVNSIKENNVSEDDLFLPFHVLNIMCTLESYDLDGNWAKISEQF